MLTKQEMFDRAYNGLASQGWMVATENGACRYLTQDGKRCAWGWVDPEGTKDAPTFSVYGLKLHNMGIAAELSYDDGSYTKDEDGNVIDWGTRSSLSFAEALQSCHDNSNDDDLQERMRGFAEKHGLTIPSL